MLRVHSSIVSAAAVKAIGEKMVTVKWNETTKQTKREVAVLLPMETLVAPEVPESFRALVESALYSSAQGVLKTFCEENPNSFEVNLDLFSRVSLTNEFLNSGSNWMKKAELEIAFTGSATWKRIVSRPEFTGNKTYQMVAERFKETILKLSGKATQIPAEDCEKILAKLENADLDTPFGEFVVSRLDALMKKKPEMIDFDAL